MQTQFQVVKNGYGQKLIIDPTDFIAKRIQRHGFYDRMGLYYIEKILSFLKNPIVFDVGANAGNHSLIMSRLSEMVYLFEPQQNLIEPLKKTMYLNNISNWKILNFGLSNETTSLPFYQNFNGNTGQSTFSPELANVKNFTQQFSVCLGDEVVSNLCIPRVDFIKIDVEGLEAKVIQGLQNTIQKYSPFMMVEWNNVVTKQQFQDYDLFKTVFYNYVIKALFKIRNISRFQKNVFKLKRFFYKNLFQENWIITEVKPELDYEHLLFIPKDKISFLKMII